MKYFFIEEPDDTVTSQSIFDDIMLMRHRDAPRPVVGELDYNPRDLPTTALMTTNEAPPATANQSVTINLGPGMKATVHKVGDVMKIDIA